MPATKAAGDPPRPRGRPSDYRPEFDEQARKLCLLLGATNEELAEFFEVTQKTITTWQRKHPSFRAAVRKGKAIADANVVERLYTRALGYTQKTEKVFANQRTGGVIRADTTEIVAPDVTAAIFWLKNRQPDRWRDRARGDELPPVDQQAAKLLAALRAIDDLEKVEPPEFAPAETLEPLEPAAGEAPTP